MIGSLKPVTKIALIAELQTVSDLNRRIDDCTGKKRASLTRQRDQSIHTIKQISISLNGQGKLSDRERMQLFSLDFVNMKKFNKGFSL